MGGCGNPGMQVNLRRKNPPKVYNIDLGCGFGSAFIYFLLDLDPESRRKKFKKKNRTNARTLVMLAIVILLNFN